MTYSVCVCAARVCCDCRKVSAVSRCFILPSSSETRNCLLTY